MGVLLALQVLGIAKEEWDKLPASKKQRILKAVKEKKYAKARQIYISEKQKKNPATIKKHGIRIDFKTKEEKTAWLQNQKSLRLKKKK